MSHQSHTNWHDSQVETMNEKYIAERDLIVDTLLDKTTIDPIDGAMVLMAVRAAERFDQIGEVKGLTEKHRNMADLLIRKSNIKFEQ